jgi:hypothetical protein
MKEKKKYTLVVRRIFVKEVVFETELEEEELDEYINSLDDLEDDNIHILNETDFEDSMDVDSLSLFNEKNEDIFDEKESNYRY